MFVWPHGQPLVTSDHTKITKPFSVRVNKCAAIVLKLDSNCLCLIIFKLQSINDNCDIAIPSQNTLPCVSDSHTCVAVASYRILGCIHVADTYS